MKFALSNGRREEARPNASGNCPACGSPMLAKCGELRVRHWAHKGQRLCDPWWENETEWHRAWKDQFPADWQEIVQHAEGGERHVADVKTSEGWVMEFQHSHLKPGERRARETFYPKLIWVVDGTRRKRDRAQLIGAWNEGAGMVGNPLLRRVFSEDCGALREWAGGTATTFFDLGETERLWCLFARRANSSAYLMPTSRAQFIEWHRSPTAETARQWEMFVTLLPELIASYDSRPSVPSAGDPLRPRAERRHFRF